MLDVNNKCMILLGFFFLRKKNVILFLLIKYKLTFIDILQPTCCSILSIKFLTKNIVCPHGPIHRSVYLFLYSRDLSISIILPKFQKNNKTIPYSKGHEIVYGSMHQTHAHECLLCSISIAPSPRLLWITRRPAYYAPCKHE